MTARRGRVAVIGAGPAGLAAALSVHDLFGIDFAELTVLLDIPLVDGTS